MTLEKMGYLSGASAAPLLLMAGAVVCAIWTVRTGNTGRRARSFAAPAGYGKE
jgi:hypothetical protein